jgi:hypothetical protein
MTFWRENKIDHVAVEMIGLFDITEGTFNQPIQTCNTGAYFLTITLMDDTHQNGNTHIIYTAGW